MIRSLYGTASNSLRGQCTKRCAKRSALHWPRGSLQSLRPHAPPSFCCVHDARCESQPRRPGLGNARSAVLCSGADPGTAGAGPWYTRCSTETLARAVPFCTTAASTPLWQPEAGACTQSLMHNLQGQKVLSMAFPGQRGSRFAFFWLKPLEVGAPPLRGSTAGHLGSM